MAFLATMNQKMPTKQSNNSKIVKILKKNNRVRNKKSKLAKVNYFKSKLFNIGYLCLYTLCDDAWPSLQQTYVFFNFLSGL